MAKESSLVLVAAVAIVAVGFFASGGSLGNFQPQSALGGGGGDGDAVTHKCGDDSSCDYSTDFKNALNDNSNEDLATDYVINSNDGQATKDLSGDQTVSLTAGKTYTLEPKSNGTSNSWVYDASTGEVANGAVEFTATSDADMTVEIGQHGNLETRATNNNADNKFNASGVTDESSFDSTDDLSFKANDNTKISIGTGGSLDATQEVRTVNFDEEFADQGAYIVVKAPTSTYKTPTVSWDGDSLSDQGVSALSENAQDAINTNNAFVYKLPQGAFNDGPSSPNNAIHDLDVRVEAESSTDPGDSDDIEVDFVAQGKAELASNDINELSVDTHDDSGNEVLNLFDTKYDIN